MSLHSNQSYGIMHILYVYTAMFIINKIPNRAQSIKILQNPYHKK